MNKETLQIPKLTNNVVVNKGLKIENKLKNNFFNLNVLVLVVFLLFFVFFLVNCGNDGIFKNISLDPIPYTMTKS